MDGIDNVQNTEEGEVKKQGVEQIENQSATDVPVTTENPAVETTETHKAKEGKEEKSEPAREMTAQQFEQYNETLRRVSKTARSGLNTRYNAFEDAEVKALVKQQVMAGGTPNINDLAASVVARLSPQPESQSENNKPQEPAAEVLSLKAENALLKAGISLDRIDAATKLFIVEGGDLTKVADFVAKYPEWHKQETGVEFSKAPPVVGKTAPNPTNLPVLNDFEKKVAAARKARGLDT